MPTRMIREGLLDSDRYARVSDASRLLFVHLMLLADDFGCVSVSATFLRRRCFYDSPSDERIARLICELVDVDLIRTYEVDRASLAFIPKFRQRLYRASLKHPKPPESLYQDDIDAATKFKEINGDSPKTPVVAPEYPVLPPPEVKRREVKHLSAKADYPPPFVRFYLAYPRKVAKGAALKAWLKLSPNDALVEQILAALAVATWDCEPQFIPHPATWLSRRQWEDEVAEKKRQVAL